MRLPTQSQPVQRNLPSQPFAFGGDSGGRGVLPSTYGVQPSGWFDDVLNGIQKVVSTAGSVGQALGGFGI